MLSNEVLSFIATVGTTVGVIGGICGIVPLLKQKGVNGGVITTVEKIGNDVKQLADDVKPYLPLKTQSVVNIIEKWAPIAAGNAEQMWHAGTISKDQRAVEANKVLTNIFKELNITVDDNKKALINAAILNAVNDLGHAPSDVKQLQNTIEDQKSQLQQTQNENGQLKQTISNAQATLQPGQANTTATTK